MEDSRELGLIPSKEEWVKADLRVRIEIVLNRMTDILLDSMDPVRRFMFPEKSVRREIPRIVKAMQKMSDEEIIAHIKQAQAHSDELLAIMLQDYEGLEGHGKETNRIDDGRPNNNPR